jgi:putative Ca2+/H+ antiporter (TMEM165/GDT1 family)
MDWVALAYTFGLIFVAEMGDKTQLAVVTQTCKYRRPWAVFVGATTALVAVTALGVVGGQVLGRFVPESVLRTLAALAFVVMGLFIAREASRVRADRSQVAACDYAGGEQFDCALDTGWDWRAFGSTLGLLFVAELGDKTQLAVMSLARKQGAPWSVFLGGAVALTAVTAVGVIGGQGLSRLIPERLLLWISAGLFITMGVLMGFAVL